MPEVGVQDRLIGAVRMGGVVVDERRVADALREAGARFALVFGSRAEGAARPDSDLDVGAWWGDRPPASWEVDLPHGWIWSSSIPHRCGCPGGSPSTAACSSMTPHQHGCAGRRRLVCAIWTRSRPSENATGSAGSSWSIGHRVVDQERLDRLLDRVASDLKTLDNYRAAAGDLLDDPTRLAAVKYHFITAIEGCAGIAHHLIVSEGWRITESNADAVRTLGQQEVVPAATAEAVTSKSTTNGSAIICNASMICKRSCRT